MNQTITQMVDSALSEHSVSDTVRNQLLILASRCFASAKGLSSDAEAVAGLERAVSTCIHLGVDLDTALSIVIGAIELVIDLEASTSPLATDSGQLLRAVRAATGTVARVYGHSTRPDCHELMAAGSAVAAALLRGESAKALGHCNQIDVADAYAILAVHLPGPRVRPLPQVGPSGAAKSTIARSYAELRRRFGADALALFADNGATILIPDTAFEDHTALVAFVDSLVTAEGTTPTAVVMRVPTPELPTVAEQVHAALELVTRLGMTGRLHRFSDIAVEYQLTRPGPGRDALATVLDPLEEHPDLLETLRCYIASGVDRRRTARRLHLHPNSVDYRLKRVSRLTGFDISDPTGLWNLRSALVIHDHRTAHATARA